MVSILKIWQRQKGLLSIWTPMENQKLDGVTLPLGVAELWTESDPVSTLRRQIAVRNFLDTRVLLVAVMRAARACLPI
jgi:hypothetical protein